MGMEFYLVKWGKKERFDLGKSGWEQIFPRDKKFRLNDLYRFKYSNGDSYEELTSWLLSVISWWWSGDTSLGYFRSLAEDISKWCGDDEVEFMEYGDFTDKVFTEQELDFEQADDVYPITGTRYHVD